MSDDPRHRHPSTGPALFTVAVIDHPTGDLTLAITTRSGWYIERWFPRALADNRDVFDAFVERAVDEMGTAVQIAEGQRRQLRDG